MATGTSLSPESSAKMGPRQRFLDTLQREHETTMKVLRAYPADRMDLRPHPRCNTARDLMWTFVMEQKLVQKALTTGFDWSTRPGPPPPAPQQRDEIIDTLEREHRRVVELVKELPEERLHQTVTFPIAPKTMGQWPIDQFLWMVLHDQIHHRGQLSIYLRMADGKLPSIYGPTADEPWM